MSRSNAAAINRRVNVPSAKLNPPAPTSTSNATSASPAQQPTPSRFTLPQVISVIDNRLVTLERFMRETQSRPALQDSAPIQYKIQETTEQEGSEPVASITVDHLNQLVEEFNERFSLFAQEISDMKDIVLKLQSYTMDVNKTLLEERIRVFSDLNTPFDPSTLDANLETSSAEDLQQNEQVATADDTSSTSIDLKNLIKQEFSQSAEN